MSYLLNGAYVFGLLVFSPWLLYKSLTTAKYRRGMIQKFFGTAFVRKGAAPCAWFHGVSVGEIHLLRQVIAKFRQRHPEWDCVVSTTTDTGFEEARKRFPELPVFYWPLDFTWAVRRALGRVDPDLIILAEGELWPNFLAAARRQGAPVVVVNGRLSPRSFRRYRFLHSLVRRLLRHVAGLAVQTEEYAAWFRALGAGPEQVHVTGSVKFDGVEMERDNPRTEELRRLLGLRPGDLVWIAGSTQTPEEEIALEIFRRARHEHPRLRLLLVPRQKERFAEVAALLQRSKLPFGRRSTLTKPLQDRQAVILVDTIGELGALWGLADIAFVGGSLDGKRGGQNMIEPAAYGAAVLFGPHVWNFRATAERLLQAGAAIQVQDGTGLEAAVLRLLADATARERLGQAARALVLSQQGATERTLDWIDHFLDHSGRRERAA